MKQFEAGKTYTTRSICVISVTIEKRTATVRGESKTFRVAEFSSYSMAPIIRAVDWNNKAQGPRRGLFHWGLTCCAAEYALAISAAPVSHRSGWFARM